MKKLSGLVSLFALMVLIGATSPSRACPFCGSQGLTLTGETLQSHLVLFGKLENVPKRTESTDILIDTVILDHPLRADRSRVTLNRFLDTTLQRPHDRFLLFCLVHNQGLEPSRGVLMKDDSKVADYIRQGVKLADQPIQQRLRFYFDYLDHAESEISSDAYREFGNADYRDVRQLAQTLPAERIVKWLQDESTARVRFGLYGLMLGHCGEKLGAKQLRSLLDNNNTQEGVDGLLAGYVMLAPDEGWTHLGNILKDPTRDFSSRYAALRAVRFFFEYRPDVIGQAKLVEAISQMLGQSDIADLIIEDLRRRGQWERASEVLPLFNRPSHRIPVIRRAIIDFALCGRDVPGTEQQQFETFLLEIGKKEPRLLRDREEQHQRGRCFAIGPAQLLAECLATQGLAAGAPLGAATHVIVAGRVAQLNLHVPDTVSMPVPVVPTSPSMELAPSERRPQPRTNTAPKAERRTPQQAGSLGSNQWSTLLLVGILLAGLLLFGWKWRRTGN